MFLSYASEDRVEVKGLSERLRADHFEPWRDSESLKPGELWAQLTLRAISESHIVVVCLSPASSGKQGFLQTEISSALAANVLIIPALLEKCDIPTELMHCHSVELFGEKGYEQLRAKISDVSRSVLPYSLGGPVPVYARHYIERDADNEVLGALERRPFTMLVRGPVQCGKSSLLTRLQNRADDMGIETTWFDPSPYLAPSARGEIKPANPNIKAVRALSRQLQEDWALDPPGNRAIESIPNWLMTALKPTASKHRLLIIDDLASLGIHAGEYWQEFIREVHNRRAGGVQISVAVGLTHVFGLDFELRRTRFGSRVHWLPRIELGWFEESQVKRLERLVAGASPTDELYNLFAGQPYLTHAAAHSESFRKSVRDWGVGVNDKSVQQVKESLFYEQHQQAILWALLGPTFKPDAAAHKLLESFVKACATKTTLDSDHESFFQKAKLLDQNGEPLVGIYKLMAENFKQIIGK